MGFFSSHFLGVAVNTYPEARPRFTAMSKTETKPKTPRPVGATAKVGTSAKLRPVLVEMVRVHRPNEAACIKALQIALGQVRTFPLGQGGQVSCANCKESTK